MLLALGTGTLTGLWPAVRASRADVATNLKESGVSFTAGRRQLRPLEGLVVAEIALAIVLVTFAGLLSKSFAGLLRTDLGYRTDHLLTFRMPLPSSRYRDDAARIQFWSKLLPQLAAMPGVTSVSAADSIPMGGTYSGAPIQIDGQAGARDWTDATARGASVTPGYFATMGIPLIAGRGFDESDTANSEPVMIVNQSFAHKLMSGRNPLGVRVRRVMADEKWARIVGVVGDSRYFGPTETQTAEAEAYLPYTLDSYLQFVALRTAVPEESVLSSAAKIIRELDPKLPITQVRTMQQSTDLATRLPRQMMLLTGGFAMVALGMCALGMGGVMAYAVSRRRREIGLRLALGARRSEVSREVIYGAGRLIAIGALAGVLIAFIGVRVLASMLYSVRPHDPMVMLAAPVLLAAIALLPCAIPARRAASIEPMAALRQE